MKMTEMPFRARAADQLEHVDALLDAERRGRLVEDQHARAEVDGARDREALPLAARHRADRPGSASRTRMPMSASFSIAVRPGELVIHHRKAPNSLRRGSRPMKKLRATLISGTSARSW